MSRPITMLRWVILVSAVGAPRLCAQAPASADLWRLSAASLAGPPSLERGATSAFWNPAGAWADTRFRAGVQVLETPDVLGVTGLLAGVTYRLSHALATVLLVGRTDVTDLIRTTTTPSSDPGEIPVFEQLVGLGIAAHPGPLVIGTLVRGHNARFDARRDNGLTLDVGVRLVSRQLTLAAASHFVPVDLRDTELTDYYAGGEYRLASPTIWGTAGRLFLRYGLNARAHSGIEHASGIGLDLAQRFRVDAILVRELGYTDASWRPGLGIEFRVGRYLISAARASGLGGIGASYRLGLDVDVIR